MRRVGVGCFIISALISGCSDDAQKAPATVAAPPVAQTQFAGPPMTVNSGDPSTVNGDASTRRTGTVMVVLPLTDGTQLENEKPVTPGAPGVPNLAVTSGTVLGQGGIQMPAFRLSDGRLVRVVNRKLSGSSPVGEPPVSAPVMSNRTVPPIRVVAPARIQSLPIEKVIESPPWFLEGATVYYQPTYGLAPNDGYIEVEIDQDVSLYVGVLCDTFYPPRQAVPAPDTVANYRQMNCDGWVDVGKLRAVNKATPNRDLFWRQFTKGDKLRFRNGIYYTPLLITAANFDSNPLDHLPDNSMSQSQARRTVKSKLERLLRLRKFDELETIVAKYRRDKSYDRGGESMLQTFYEATTPGVRTVADRENLLKLLEEWRAAKPLSAAAHYAQIDFWNEYAWMARDGGADTSDLAYRRQRDRYRNARSLLLAAEKLTERDAYYFHLEAESSLYHDGMDGMIKKMDDVFAESLKFDPDFLFPLTEGARYYRARWYGGDMEQYAARCAELTKLRHGDSVYTLCAISEAKDDGLEKPKDYHFDWSRLKQGFADLRKRFPDSVEHDEWNCKFAVLYEDWNEAKAAFARLERHPAGAYELGPEMMKWRHWARRNAKP